MIEGRAALVDHHGLATALEAGVEGEHAAARYRGLKKEIPQVPGEHRDRVRFADVGHLTANFPLQARENQPRQRVADAGPQELGMRMVG